MGDLKLKNYEHKITLPWPVVGRLTGNPTAIEDSDGILPDTSLADLHAENDCFSVIINDCGEWRILFHDKDGKNQTCIWHTDDHRFSDWVYGRGDL
jgi:hypothetical protein